uniref:Rad21-like protein n=1 Tax=Tetraselmis sp. GSL018 TaxID=582737 RepID=A0A061SCS7_9CHLO|eukprot:CAMPEP_0177594494 /NCGR_PEP_ID=MMETSP0419_2-20121207/9813_1 /TAXON_ID=582737 /ORGANISM="Tetraselmis sp., Strain GSL018" /LENGTH=658 /DNA_ID=CAMNT_0019085811 /DNA_START=56 /DNA_END=2032 /DNA_ORIENTATION=-
MFFSTTLLGKKSPLGVAWLVSHGKKVPKQKILQIKVEELCEQLLDPEVPHALRLQGILCAGVTLVYSRQQTYLLHDCQETMKRLLQVMMPHNENTMLPRGKEAAQEHTITLALESVPFGNILSVRPQLQGDVGDIQEEMFYVDFEQDQDNEREGKGKARKTDGDGFLQTNIAIWPEGYSGNFWDLTQHTVENHPMISPTAPLNTNPELDPETFQGVLNLMDEDEDLKKVLETETGQQIQSQSSVEIEEPKNIATDETPAETDRQNTKSELLEKPSSDAPSNNNPGSTMTTEPAGVLQKKRKRQGIREKPQIPIDDDVVINTHIYREWQQSAEDLVIAERGIKKQKQAALENLKSSQQHAVELLGLPATKQLYDNPVLLKLFRDDIFVLNTQVDPPFSCEARARQLPDLGHLAGGGAMADGDVPVHAEEATVSGFQEGQAPVAGKKHAEACEHVQGGQEIDRVPKNVDSVGWKEPAAGYKPVPESSSDIEAENLRGVGSTPGDPSLLSFQSQQDKSPVSTALSARRQNEDHDDGARGEEVPGHPAAFTKTPCHLTRFQELVDERGSMQHAEYFGDSGNLNKLPRLSEDYSPDVAVANHRGDGAELQTSQTIPDDPKNTADRDERNRCKAADLTMASTCSRISIAVFVSILVWLRLIPNT